MNLKINTYLLKGFDAEQTNFINSTVEYISSISGIDNNVKIINDFSLKLDQHDFLILFIDELYLEQIIQNQKNKEFFIKKEFRNNQIILILDDIEIHKLPDYLQYFQTFYIHNNDVSNDLGDSWNTHNETKTQLFDIINDIVQYEKRIKLGQNNKALTIYIGPSDDNTTLEYQKITRELLHRNFNLIPEVSNPSAKEVIENPEYFKNLLESADLSVHFIGHNSILEYPEKQSSALKINKVTADFCNSPEGEMLQRIIYVPNEQSENNDILNQKVLQFKSDTYSLTNAELVQTPIEKFKEVVLQKLNELGKPFSQIDNLNEESEDIYFIYPPGYASEAKPYSDWLKKHDFSFCESQIELDQLELLNYHQKKLTTCKGVLILNTGNTEWLKRKLSDLKKSPGWGRKTKFKLKAIIGAEINNLESNGNSFIAINDYTNLDSKKFKTLLSD